MDINQLKPSKVLRKEHLPEPPRGVRIIIDRVGIAEPLGFQQEKINVLHFRPHAHLPHLPIRLSGQILDQIALICGERDFTRWGGREIVIWHDPTVLSGGKPVGGIRARPPKPAAPPAAPTPAAAQAQPQAASPGPALFASDPSWLKPVSDEPPFETVDDLAEDFDDIDPPDPPDHRYDNPDGDF